MTTGNPLVDLVDDLVAKGHHDCASCLREVMATLSASHDEDAAIGRIVKQQAGFRQAMLDSNKAAAPGQIHTDPTLTVLQQIIEHGRAEFAGGAKDGGAAPRISSKLPELAPRNSTDGEDATTGSPTATVLSDGGPPCNTHPDAPHGFNRNGSHSADRYMCDCEGWQPGSAWTEARPINDAERDMLRDGLANGTLSIQGGGDVAWAGWRSQMPGDTAWLLTAHEPTPAGIIKQPLITLDDHVRIVDSLRAASIPNSSDSTPTTAVETLLPRWGKAPQGSSYLLQPLEDGYWTPWHTANTLVADHARIVASLEADVMALQKNSMRLMIDNIGLGAPEGILSASDSARLDWIIDQACDFYPSSEGSNTTEPDLYAVALNLGAGQERRERVRAYIDERIRPEATAGAGGPAKAHEANTDRQAIRLLVDAGFVVEDTANHALLIAKGFSKGPMPKAREARDNVAAALERGAELLPLGWEVRLCVERDAGTVDIIDYEGNTLEHDFNYDEGLAGAVHDAIDTAIAIDAQKPAETDDAQPEQEQTA